MYRNGTLAVTTVAVATILLIFLLYPYSVRERSVDELNYAHKEMKVKESCKMLSLDQGLVKFNSDWSYTLAPLSEACSVKGLVILLHSCGYSGEEWWKYLDLPSVSKNNTLPAESRTALQLHNSGFILLSVSSYVNRMKSKCWHNDDVPHLAKVIQQMHSNIAFQLNRTVPLFALGIFRGGFFLGSNAWSLYSKYGVKLNGIVIMNSGVWNRDYKRPGFPHTFFIDMNRNGHNTLHNVQTVKDMTTLGLRSVHYSSDPWPLTPDYFYKEGVLSINDSVTLFGEMKKNAKYLWPGSNILLVDPSELIYLKEFTALVARLLPDYIRRDALKGTHSPLLQSIRKAYGYRETNDEFTPQVKK